MEENRNEIVENRTTDHGIFGNRESTENAYTTLQERGYAKDDINFNMPDETRKKKISGDVKKNKVGTKATEGAGKGSAIGSIAGAIAGIIATIGTSLFIPGLEIVIAGPVAAGLVGAVAGAITGGIIGGLVGAGIPEERAKLYEPGIRKGQMVIGDHPRNDKDIEYVENIRRTHRAEEIHS